MNVPVKLNLGAGRDIRVGWVNHDISQIFGIDVVHDLNIRPWPWGDLSVGEVIMKDVLEHLDDFLQPMEELWRILIPGGKVTIRVPFMDSWSFFADPTHKRSFCEATFGFLDPSSPYCRERSYYSHARFYIRSTSLICAPFIPYFTFPIKGDFRVTRRFPRAIIGLVTTYFLRNLVQDIEVDLEKCESDLPL